MAHPNEELVRSAFDAFAKGDVDTLRESMDQDAVWYVPGRNQPGPRQSAGLSGW
jgi:ketosteroid isomerase-like protein